MLWVALSTVESSDLWYTIFLESNALCFAMYTVHAVDSYALCCAIYRRKQCSVLCFLL